MTGSYIGKQSRLNWIGWEKKQKQFKMFKIKRGNILMEFKNGYIKERNCARHRDKRVLRVSLVLDKYKNF